MTGHGKKIAAPVLVTIGIIAYYALLAAVMLLLVIPFLIKLIVVVFSVIITVLTAAVLIERIKEIRSGEEDDLGQY